MHSQNSLHRKGIISVGTWLVDTVKMIDSYPARGNLATIRQIDAGLGGCAHNVLADLLALQSGLPLYAGGCVGDDSDGKRILREIADRGIDTQNMHVLPGETTSYTDVMAEIGGQASRTFFHYRGANARLSPSHVSSVAVPAKIFHLGYLLLLDELDKCDPEYGTVAARVLHDLQRRGYATSVDVVSEEGDRFRQVIGPCLPYVDYFIVNEIEAGACSGRALRKKDGSPDLEEIAHAAQCLMECGIRQTCVIHFPEGGYRLNRDGTAHYEPSLHLDSAQIRSTVGAGDAFCAGMLYALHEELPLRESLLIANVSARFNLRSTTSTGGAPTLREIRNFIRQNYQNISL